MSIMKPISVKERKILNSYIKTGNYAKTGMELTNYSSKDTARTTTQEIIRKPIVQLRLQQLFDQQGLTEECIAKKLHEKTNAKRCIFFSKDGVVTDEREVEDHTSQLKALEMVVDLRGMKVSRTAHLNLNLSGDDLHNLSNDELEYMIRECDSKLNEGNTT